MFASPIVTGSLAPILMIDVIIVVAVVIIANVVFNAFEKHLPPWRRVLKHGVLVLILVSLGLGFGRVIFYGLLGLLTLGQIVLHAWYFPKHDVNGLTAEPYDTYLTLIHHMKRKGERT